MSDVPFFTSTTGAKCSGCGQQYCVDGYHFRSSIDWASLISPVVKSRSRFIVPGKKVAVEPFSTNAIKTETRNGVLLITQKLSLERLKVIFDGGGRNAGEYVWVRGTLATNTNYGKEIFEVEGQKFILINEDDVVLVDQIPSTEVQPK